jgi:hypothetical protein
MKKQDEKKLDLDNLAAASITDIKVIDVPISKIQPFHAIPDFYCLYSLPYPVVIYKGEIFYIIGGATKVQGVSGQLEPIRCIEIVVEDNSDESIALEKIALFVRPMGGKASYAEVVNAVSGLVSFIKNQPGISFNDGWGGQRRGEDFKAAETLPKVLSERLKKSTDTTYRYVYYGKFLSTECLAELAKNKASRDFFDKIQPKKTKLVDSLKNMTEAEISIKVSGQVLQWWQEYSNPNDFTGESKPEEQAAQKNSATKNSKTKTSNKVLAADGSSESAQKSKPSPTNDEIKEAIESDDPDESDNEDEEENDVVTYSAKATQTPQTDNLSHDESNDIVGELTKIGNNLIHLGKAGVNPEELVQPINDAIEALFGLIAELEKWSPGQPEMTLVKAV